MSRDAGSETTRVAVGRIARAHGVEGEVAVDLHTENDERFAPGAVLSLDDGHTLTVRAARPHQRRLLTRFEEVHDRNGAEALRGAYLFVSIADLPPLPEGAFWPHELEGCAVVTEDGGELGTLTAVLAGPPDGNDVWSVEGQDGTVLVPATHDAVVSVDIDARRIVVRADRLA